MTLTARVLIVIVCVTACGCSAAVVSTNPLSSPDDAPLKPGFIGTWRTNDCPDNEVNFVHVGAAGEGFPRGVMHFLFVSQPKDEKLSVSYREYLGFFSTINDDEYLNLIIAPKLRLSKDPCSRITKWGPKSARAYFFLKLQSRCKGQVKLLPISVDAMERNVKDGNITGSVQKSKEGTTVGVNLTASTIELRRFFGSPRHQKVFSENGWLYDRVK